MFFFILIQYSRQLNKQACFRSKMVLIRFLWIRIIDSIFSPSSFKSNNICSRKMFHKKQRTWNQRYHSSGIFMNVCALAGNNLISICRIFSFYTVLRSQFFRHTVPKLLCSSAAYFYIFLLYLISQSVVAICNRDRLNMNYTFLIFVGFWCFDPMNAIRTNAVAPYETHCKIERNVHKNCKPMKKSVSNNCEIHWMQKERKTTKRETEKIRITAHSIHLNWTIQRFFDTWFWLIAFISKARSECVQEANSSARAHPHWESENRDYSAVEYSHKSENLFRTFLNEYTRTYMCMCVQWT